MPQILETAMLVCFGFSWPISLIKNINAGTAKNMSLHFNLLIIVGYLAGITAKVLSGNTGYVLAAYIINLVAVSANVVVYFINKRKDNIKEKASVANIR